MNLDAALACLCDCWGKGSVDPAERGDGFYPEMLEILGTAALADRVSLMVRNGSENELIIEASIGLPQGIPENTVVRLGHGISGWVASNQRPLLLATGQDLPHAILGAMQNPSITSALSVPVFAGNEPLGVLNLARCGPQERFDESHVRFAVLAGYALGTLLRDPGRGGVPNEGERLLSRVLENIPCSTVIVDRHRRVTAANQIFLKRTHRSNGATRGRQLVDVVPRSLLDQVGANENIEEVFRTGHVMEGGKVAYRAPNAPTRTYSVRFAPVISEVGREVQQVMLLMDDVTELEKLGAEARRVERHRAILEESEEELLVSLDAKGCIVSWNSAVERATGRVLAEMQGESIVELCAEGDREAFRDILRQVAMGSGVRGLETTLLGRLGQDRVVLWQCPPLCDDDGAVVGIGAVGRDVTEHRRMEHRLIQSEKMASLGVMAGGIAHELRNPLTIIAMAAELAQGAPSDSALCGECLDKIDTSAKRASDVIEGLLKFAGLQGDKSVAVDVKDLLEITFRFMSDQLVAHRVRARVEVGGDCAMALGNPGLLQQVFINVILNACDAMREGGELVAGAASSANGMVTITFCDTGEGIHPEDLARVFDPFFTTRAIGSGRVGLGLSIAYSIVRQHAGSIEVESEPGLGSTITIVVPSS